MPRTPITVIGNVVGSPSRVRLPSGDSVTNFRLASTDRRFDQEQQGFVDASTFFVDVECWGEMGGNVAHSVSKGDPIVVFGWIRTDEWESEQGRRSKARVRAEAVGLNLARGTVEFKRSRREPAEPDLSQPGPSDPGAPDGFAPGVDASAEFRAGEDYVVGPETLEDVDSEETFREPALR